MHHVRGFIKLLRNQTLHHCGVARLLVELVTRISNSNIKHVYFILKQTHIHRDIHFIYFKQILKGIWNLKLFFIHFSWHFRARNWIKIQDGNSTSDNVSSQNFFNKLSVSNKNCYKHFPATPRLASLRDNSAIWSTYAAIYGLPRMFYLGGIKFFCTLDWKWKDYNKSSWPGVAFLRSKQYWFITGTNTRQFIQNGTYWKSFRIKATLEML